MKEQTPPEKDEVLSKLLRTWTSEAPVPPRFQESVWKRIERANSGVKVPLWRVLVAQMEAAFRRPAFAVVYVSILLIAGIGAGYWHAEDSAAQAKSELRARYVQSIDPYQMPRN